MSSKQSIRVYFILLVVVLLAYLPISSLHFALKNDAFTDNFPNKFFLSECLSSGNFPLWNPYLGFGFPIYADPGFAYWNPITWLFALVGYNAYTFTIEVLLYIYLAGVLMYRLGRYLQFENIVAIIVAIMYMCCGFFVGEIQHINFLTAATFIPVVIQRVLQLQKQSSISNSFSLAIAYYFICVGGHPAIPVGMFYFLAAFLLLQLAKNKTSEFNLKKIIAFHLLAIITFLLLFSPAIYSYINIFPFYGRNQPINQLDPEAFLQGFSPGSYLSFIYPFSTIKAPTWIQEDVAMRNSYFSLIGFFLLLLAIKKNWKQSRYFIIPGILMLVLSMGGMVKATLYSFLPLLQYLKTNGEFRIFTIFSFCIVAGFALQHTSTEIITKWLRKFVITMTTISAIIVGGFIFNNNNSFSLPTFLLAGAKDFIDHLTFSKSLAIAAFISIPFLLAILYSKNLTIKKILVLVIVDIALQSVLYLPISGVGRITVAEVQAAYNRSPKGIPIPKLIAINSLDTVPTKVASLIGDWSYYSKNIGIEKMPDYPSFFRTTENYFKSSLPQIINNRPFIFMDNYHSEDIISIQSYSPTQVVLNVNSKEKNNLNFLQNNYKFWNASIDGKHVQIHQANISFIGLEILPGRHRVSFHYKDPFLPVFVTLSLSVFLFIMGYKIRIRFYRIHKDESV